MGIYFTHRHLAGDSGSHRKIKWAKTFSRRLQYSQ